MRNRIGRWGPEPPLELGNARSEARWLRYWGMWREDCHHYGRIKEERMLAEREQSHDFDAEDGVQYD